MAKRWNEEMWKFLSADNRKMKMIYEARMHGDIWINANHFYAYPSKSTKKFPIQIQLSLKTNGKPIPIKLISYHLEVG